MADILIRGGDSDTAAHEMRAAVREIFGFDPLQTTRGSSNAPGTRSGVELAAMIALGLAARQSAGDPSALAQQVVSLQSQIGTMQQERAREKAMAFVDGAIKLGNPMSGSANRSRTANKAVSPELTHPRDPPPRAPDNTPCGFARRPGAGARHLPGKPKDLADRSPHELNQPDLVQRTVHANHQPS